MKIHRLLSILLIAALLPFSLAACGGEEETTPEATPAAAVETLEPAAGQPVPNGLSSSNPKSGQAVSGKDPSEWLVMMYEDGDDDVLEEDTFIDLNEAEMVGSTDAVRIVAQLDRAKGGFSGDGDWSSAKRFLVQKDTTGDMEKLHSKELADLGEVDMSAKQTLVDFVLWAIRAYPAKKYALVLSDHGMGWPGGWTDVDSKNDGQLYTYQIDEALAEVVKKTGIGQFELVGFDACLMAQLESFSALAPYARYAVASEETEPAIGWAYASFLQALSDQPTMNGQQLAKNIVSGYIEKDGRITDDKARKALVSESFERSSMNAKEVAEAFGSDITLSAVDLQALKGLNGAVNDLALALVSMKPAEIAKARTRAQKYTNIFGEDSAKSYLDLGHFAKLLQEGTGPKAVKQAAQKVGTALAAAVVAEKHGPKREGSTGLAFYFPNSKLFKDTVAEDWLQYTLIAGRFAAASLWDDFLAYHYTGKKIDPASADLSVLDAASTEADFSTAVEASAPEAGATIEGPGASAIRIDQWKASKKKIKADGKLTLTADITGKNIAYIYLYTAYYDPDSDSYLTMDTDFLDAGSTKEVGGVSFPDWGEDETQSFEIPWEPFNTTLSDGVDTVFAASEAETYGDTSETTTYQVWGTYQVVGTKEGREAFLRFDANGDLKTVFVFSGDKEKAAPREINPKKGDIFTPEEEWLSFEKNPDGEYEYYDGEPLTFGKDGFSMASDTAAPGKYQIGLIVEDLDGNTVEEYVEVDVE